MEIITYPNPVLRQKAADIGVVSSEIKKLIAEMRETLKEKNGVGLAAPQVGKSLKLIVIGFEPTTEQLEKNPDLKPIPQTLLINPKIVWRSKDTSSDKEACLSVPKVEVEIARRKKIHAEYRDEAGKRKKIKARGILARVIQHEMDHLEGRLIIDYKK